MAKDKLIVKNFGPIKEVDINLAKVTVFIGEQASGKSVLAKLAALLSDPVALQRSNYLTDWIHPGLEEFNIHNFLDVNSSASFESDKFAFGFTDNSMPFKSFNDERLRITFDKVNEISREMENSKESFLLKSSPTEEGTNAYFKNQEILFDQLHNVSLLAKSLFLEPVYIPTERNLISIISTSLYNFLINEVDLPKFIKVFGNKFESSRRGGRAVNIPALNLKYSFSENLDKIVLENGKQIGLFESSSGVQSITPIAVILNAIHKDSKHLFIVEEPELNLYPTTQKALVEYLIEKCTHGDNRLIITTHSPYILTALNNCIQAKNVVNMHPESAEEVEKLVPSKYHLDYQDVAAYYVGGGTAKSIMNEEFQMIDANQLDDVSEQLGSVFDKLLNLKYQDQD